MKHYRFKNKIYSERILKEFFEEKDIQEMQKIGLIEATKLDRKDFNKLRPITDDIFGLPEMRIYLTDKVIEG